MADTFVSPFDTNEALPPEIIANPYPNYHQLRIEDPVHWNGPMGTWNLTRYSDVMETLRDRRMSSDRMSLYVDRIPEQMQEIMAPILSIFSNMMLVADPPRHTRLRSLANKAFTPRVVENMRSGIEAIVEELLDGAAAAGRMDVIRDLAYPLPMRVISGMLGVAPEDRDQFKKWTDDLAMFLGDVRGAAEHVGVAQRSALEMVEYLKGIIRECRENPRDDLITALVAAEEQGDTFSEEELYAMFVLLQIGGHETTTNLIGNGLLALLQNPGEMQKLIDDPALMGTAVEELLRYHSPIQITARIATEDLEIGGKQIAKGQFISTYLGAANRDPEYFSEPDRLDVTREENRHLAFAFGPHFCLGAALARLEGQTAIGAVLRRMPDLRLEPPFAGEEKLEAFPWRPNPIFHGLERLPVVF
jgi:cytochrome P450